MKKYLMVIARYKDWRQEFFETYFSPRNREYCEKWGFEYLEITNENDLELYRGNPTWWKFTIIRDLITSGKLNDGDIVTHLDADMAIVDIEKEYVTKKSFSYSIDSGNTHCMGSYSLKINDLSKNMINLLLDEDRYNRLNHVVTQHPGLGHFSPFWYEFREQASWYSLAGIIRHSWIPFWDLPNFGWHSDKNVDTVYTIEELYENVDILSSDWNVTEMIGETDGRFNINKSNPNDVIIRHFSGGQPWRKEWLDKIKK
jgi:hypothetical protein